MSDAANADPPAEMSKKALKKLEKLKLKESAKQSKAAEQAAQQIDEVDTAEGLYGNAPLNQSQVKTATKFVLFNELGQFEGQSVHIIARVMNIRPQGSKMVFLTLRQKGLTTQALLLKSGVVSKQMLKFCSLLNPESILHLEAIVTKAPEEIKSCDVKNHELKISKVFVMSQSARLPFSVDEASRSAKEIEENEGYNPIHLDTRLNNRVIDLRTNTNRAIFRIQAAVTRLFREYLDGLDFIEIHSPKMQGSASEGGANVFKVTYFKGDAYLAQSPQLYKQMAICADFDRVYEIAPVFRAENSFTHRHMTEFMGLDMEMAFNEHYHEVLNVLCKMFVHIFKGLRDRHGDLLTVVGKQYPFEEFKFREETLILQFPEAIALLRENGHTVGDFEDFSTEMEKTLGMLVKKKYDTDFYVLDKFPMAVRPFYTMPDPNMKVFMQLTRDIVTLMTFLCEARKLCLEHNVFMTLNFWKSVRLSMALN